MQKTVWFICGVFTGLVILGVSKAAIPVKGKVTDDTVLYQHLSEINLPKQPKVDFDADISRLAQLEDRYRDKKLPLHNRLKAPMSRIAHVKYRRR